jgi:divalent metal cation (Fe/Co/Zn/Cd) transporter
MTGLEPLPVASRSGLVSPGPTGVRHRSLRRSFDLELLTVAWNMAECLIAVTSGLAAGSLVLLAFGFDSLIEMTSAAVVALRVWTELRGGGANVAAVEKRAARWAGFLLLVLAATVLFEAVRCLLGRAAHPAESRTGILLTAVAAVVMPALGWAKLRLARRLSSNALRIEAEQTIACAWFSLATLAGLWLNAVYGWWWADPVAAIVLVPWMVREGVEPFRPAAGPEVVRRPRAGAGT